VGGVGDGADVGVADGGDDAGHVGAGGDVAPGDLPVGALAGADDRLRGAHPQLAVPGQAQRAAEPDDGGLRGPGGAGQLGDGAGRGGLGLADDLLSDLRLRFRQRGQEGFDEHQEVRRVGAAGRHVDTVHPNQWYISSQTETVMKFLFIELGSQPRGIRARTATGRGPHWRGSRPNEPTPGTPRSTGWGPWNWRGP